FFRRTNQTPTDCFDLIAGTSTGAIVGGCAAFGIDLAVATELFVTKGPLVFKPRWAAGLRRGPRYSAAVLRAALEELFRSQTLGHAKIPVLFPSALFDEFGHHLFTTKSTPRILATDAILCSSAAPTYFAPVKPTGEQRSFVDGGVWANNPAL